ncbi:mce related family protein [Ehrlichia chaffeensis str. Heartland]|uniref:Mce-related protein n=1 Tax=Ehrlichia chaffeensis (strain ATCC CRL-10679 / Arkansas) TaxID=205920 RepID=Q2GHS5_EHRCR|nr:outer membrane lipid asymmetry maintenance protein MlaD [Ehrlichia chaffeensis]ABD45269.1 mce-related protein [Ehrlichia chaffeensis str. Arkansas]AHX04024.1 mce related family protein [Ehrlichia chaffeensis str. Heartland]AHX05958.1 mce related family protein [Ehrlichia chaffeensis str. Jax]AHX06948.1 mce related family protein [Ehrlichia chaffeensis str. Liberty]AHX07676.1 mce related family protein [Ehrlichia chaffeensis str. Osceola]
MRRSNVIEIFAGLIVLVAAVSIGIIAFKKLPLNTTSHNCYIVKAHFPSVDGLDIGDDITLSGVKIGTVTSISLDKNYSPTVTMCIQKNILLPSDSSASLSLSNLLGRRHIDIALGSNEDVIPVEGFIEHTSSDLNLNVILTKLVNKFVK